ncbi:hypothetical protein [Bacillus bombysepticus]|uniref:hypothetical protein n=1 Tax=Bacillus bombysepticus TaxID=658666 RepID=UPI00301A859B
MNLNNDNHQNQENNRKAILNTYKDFVIGMLYLQGSFRVKVYEYSAEYTVVDQAFGFVPDYFLDADFDDEVTDCQHAYEEFSGNEVFVESATRSNDLYESYRGNKVIVTFPTSNNKTLLKLGFIMVEDALLSYKRLRGENGEFALKELDGFLSDKYMMNFTKPFLVWKEGMLDYINKH